MPVLFHAVFKVPNTGKVGQTRQRPPARHVFLLSALLMDAFFDYIIITTFLIVCIDKALARRADG